MFEKEIKHLSSGGDVVVQSEDLFALFLNSFVRSGRVGTVLLVSDDDVFNKDQRVRSAFFNNEIFYYPDPGGGEVVPGFQSRHNYFRSRSLIGLLASDGGVCITTSRAANLCDINKKKKLNKISLRCGDEKDRDVLVQTLLSFGYVLVDSVYSTKEVAVRGDIVDVFPESTRQPVRISFDYNVVGAIAFFSVDSQRKTKKLSSFLFYDLIGEPVEVGTSLLQIIRWRLVISVKNEETGVRLFSGEKKQTITIASKGVVDVVSSKNSFTAFAIKYKKVRVVYTNNERVKPLVKMGAEPVPGLIKSPFVLGGDKTAYLPDWKTKKQLVAPLTNTNKPLLLNSLQNIRAGDFVVHVLHGVGEFGGLVTRGAAGFEKEYIKLIYREGGVLFVPIGRLDLVHRYVGLGTKPKTNRLGKRGWASSVSKTKKHIEQISGSLVEIYNTRRSRRGFVYEKSNEFDAAIKKSFPHKETKDQKKAINEVLSDLQKKTPMDRLVCGDVGFGKTEVALRAIVRASTTNKQTLFLCPTTVLSDQHYITAKERLGPLGIRVSLLSRFQTKSEQKKILTKVLRGGVNLVVGTHRLLSDDVVVPFLGLLIVDEEHRFGVRHKESIRVLKKGVDVLSLSATPIPRTLQQSLLGIRDISRIETPPTTRKPIKTFVEFFSWKRSVEIIEEEVLRGGQVYFLHNHVQSISYYTNKLRELFPNERVEYIHGQQDSKGLEKNLLDFFGGDISILICSTIIESGLDVANANCIIINNPQNLGLSQLYQIRGRVGRGSRQASCYLFVPKKTKLRDRAFRRLKTIENNTSLGSGYKIATNDLSLRGAGFVFGYKQSGQVSRVGVEHYNALLKEAVNKKLKKTTPGAGLDVLFYGKSLIPKNYIVNDTVRLSFYTKINKAETKEGLKDIKEELVDRFGGPPRETKSFMRLAHIKLLYKKTIVKSVAINKGSIVFEVQEEDVGKNTVNDVLAYKNSTIVNKSFKEGHSSLSVEIALVEGVDWFSFLVDCNSVFVLHN